MIQISNITGRVAVRPPVKRGVVSPAICATHNLTLRVVREGVGEEVARYPAVSQDGQWEFVIDDVWRLAKPGFYLGTVYCCETRLRCYRFHLGKDALGDADAVDMRHGMCDDLNAPACATTAAPCPDVPCAPQECFSSEDCGVGCSTDNGAIPPPTPCNKLPIPCSPC